MNFVNNNKKIFWRINLYCLEHLFLVIGALFHKQDFYDPEIL